MSLGRYDDAIAAITEALGLEPGDAASHSALGRAYWVRQGKLHEGIAELERALTINPEIGWAYLQLALLYALVGEYVKAEAASNKAIAFQQRYASGRGRRRFRAPARPRRRRPVHDVLHCPRVRPSK